MAENKNSKFAGISNLVLSSRKNLSITGVKDVDRFDDKEIIAITNQGKLKINGANLKIGKLSVESGTLDLSGKINYHGKSSKRRGNSMRRYDHSNFTMNNLQRNECNNINKNNIGEIQEYNNNNINPYVLKGQNILNQKRKNFYNAFEQ